VEYYLAIKTNEALIHATIWMNIENTILSKTKQNKIIKQTQMAISL
jgi:hypothetical protein